MNMLKSLFGGGSNTLSAQEAKARIDSGENLFILDVRQPNEYRSGHIPNAVLIPLDKLTAGAMTKLPKDAEILCVCRSGARSGTAANQLTQAGFRAVNLRGGMIAWQSAGLPVKQGN